MSQGGLLPTYLPYKSLLFEGFQSIRGSPLDKKPEHGGQNKLAIRTLLRSIGPFTSWFLPDLYPKFSELLCESGNFCHDVDIFNMPLLCEVYGFGNTGL